MSRGDKAKYTGKQRRKADHVADSYESRGVSAPEAERRAWGPTSAGQSAEAVLPSVILSRRCLASATPASAAR